MIDNKILRKIFGPKREEQKVNGENYIMLNFIIYMGMRI